MLFSKNINKIKKKKYNHIIFFHMLRTGGNTVKKIIDNQYSSDKIFQIAKEGYQTGPVENFVKMKPSDRNKIKLLRGHMYFGAHKYFDGDTYYFGLVRNPIERMISFYNEVTSRDREWFPKDERKTFKDFIENVDKYHFQGNNGQTRALAGENVEEKDIFNNALKNIEDHFFMVAITERFEEALLLICKYLNWSYPYFVKRKVSRKTLTMDIISEEDRKLVLQKNQLDIKLYAYVSEEFDKLVDENKKYIIKQKRVLSIINLFYKFYFNASSKLKKILRPLLKIKFR